MKVYFDDDSVIRAVVPEASRFAARISSAWGAKELLEEGRQALPMNFLADLVQNFRTQKSPADPSPRYGIQGAYLVGDFMFSPSGRVSPKPFNTVLPEGFVAYSGQLYMSLSPYSQREFFNYIPGEVPAVQPFSDSEKLDFYQGLYSNLIKNSLAIAKTGFQSETLWEAIVAGKHEIGFYDLSGDAPSSIPAKYPMINQISVQLGWGLATTRNFIVDAYAKAANGDPGARLKVSQLGIVGIEKAGRDSLGATKSVAFLTEKQVIDDLESILSSLNSTLGILQLL